MSDLFAPVSGEVTDINGALAADPELVNSDPYGEGWMIRLKLSDPEAAAATTDRLMDAESYRRLGEAG